MRANPLRRLAALGLALGLLSGCAQGPGAGADGAGAARAAAFRERAETLRSAALTDQVREDLGAAPAGEAGCVVFFSVCGGTEQASVYSAAGDTLDGAWDAAASAAETALERGGPAPLWVKADLVYLSQAVPADWLENIGTAFGSGGFRYGLAFDPDYRTALLEAELNSEGICDYENGGVNLERLNGYLRRQGRKELPALPEEYTAFQCAGWFCDEAGNVFQLGLEDLGYGRRELSGLSGETAAALALDGAEYLARQVGEDGSISVGGGEGLDAARHAEVLSAMVRGYALQPGETLAGGIDRAAGRLLAGTVYTGSGMAYVPDGGEITLESCALALIALADCAEASGDSAYLPACEALGAGILSLLDTETGAFTHVLDAGSLGRKASFRSAAWDGMGVTALCRLYALTEDTLWLWAAGLALDRMAAEDYTRYGDAWTSYAVCEITKYERDRPGYFALALKNAQRNLAAIYGAGTASPAGLELLMASYETCRRMADAGYSSGGFELELMLQVIYARARRQLDGYLFPESAMYLAEPQAVLGAFMTREAGLAVLAEDVCRNIRGYSMYAANYDGLLSDGLPAAG